MSSHNLNLLVDSFSFKTTQNVFSMEMVIPNTIEIDVPIFITAYQTFSFFMSYY